MTSAKTKVVMRVFKCPVCGGVLLASKNAGKQTGNGHIKDMFCPYCNDTRKFIQIGTA